MHIITTEQVTGYCGTLVTLPIVDGLKKKRMNIIMSVMNNEYQTRVTKYWWGVIVV